MKVVGIDPGTTRVGYALIEGTRHAPRLVWAETIFIPARESAPERLSLIERAVHERLIRDRPDIVGVEKLFFAKNSASALSVAEARGVILLTAHREVHTIGEYTPLEVKMAVASYGRADKAQVRRALRYLLPHTVLPKGDDAVDAIAIALTAITKAVER